MSTMKRALSILILCSLLVTTTVGTVIAGNPDYSIIEYTGGVILATVDGVWTDTEEWRDALLVNVTEEFRFWYHAEITAYICEFCVEVFDDDTDDAGDYWEFCFDDDNSSATAPTVNCTKITIDGHTDLTMYRGNGQGWDEITPDTNDQLTWADEITTSFINESDHWILEFTFMKTQSILPTAPPSGCSVAAYDADTQKLSSWPPDTDPDDPSTWGVISEFSAEAAPYVPEAFTFAVMAILSTISLLVGSHYLRKHTKK